MNLDIELQPGSSIRVETLPHELLQSQVAHTLEGVRIEIRNGTQFYLTLDIPQTEHLIYDLQKCLRQITDRTHSLPGDSMRSTS